MKVRTTALHSLMTSDRPHCSNVNSIEIRTFGAWRSRPGLHQRQSKNTNLHFIFYGLDLLAGMSKVWSSDDTVGGHLKLTFYYKTEQFSSVLFIGTIGKLICIMSEAGIQNTTMTTQIPLTVKRQVSVPHRAYTLLRASSPEALFTTLWLWTFSLRTAVGS